MIPLGFVLYYLYFEVWSKYLLYKKDFLRGKSQLILF